MIRNVRQDLCKRVYAPPFRGTGVQCYVFILKGNGDTIQEKVIDPMLVGFKPWNVLGSTKDLFVVAWFRYANLASQDAEDCERGVFEFNESLVFSLVEGTRDAPKGLRGKFLHTPCLYLNKFAPIAGGREVYGMPKSWGDVTIPKGPPGASGTDRTLSTDADEVLKFGTPPEKPTRVRMMEAHPDPSILNPVILAQENKSRKTSEEFIKDNLEDVRNAIRERAGPLTDAVVEVYQNLALWKIPQVFLKQPLSSEAAETTSSPSYVILNSRVDFIQREKLFQYKVRLGDADSAPLARSYGVRPGMELKPLMAYWLEFDFTMGMGKEIPVKESGPFHKRRG